MSNLQKFDDPYTRIEYYYTNSGELSEADQRIAARLELAFALLQEHRIRKFAVAKLIATEKASGRNLSTAQAYRDMKMAEKIFVPIQKYSKEILKLILIESAMKDLAEVEKKMADKAKKPTSAQWIQMMLLKDRIESRIIDISGIADENSDLPDFSLLETHQYTIGLPEDQQEILKNLISKGAVNLSSLLGPAEEIDYTEDDDAEAT